MSIEAQVLGASFHTRDVEVALLQLSHSAGDHVTRLALREAYEFLQRDPSAAAVDPDILEQLVNQKLPPNHRSHFACLLQAARDSTGSLPNVRELDYAIRRDEWADKLISAVGSTSRNWDAINTLLDARPEQGAADISPLSFEGEEIRGDGIRLGIQALDKKFGEGLSRGHHLLIYARPEIGKSLLAINIACGLARQGLRGVYFENEEPDHITKLRMLQCLSETRFPYKLPAHKRPEKWASNIVVHSLQPGTLGEISAISKGCDWIVVNQLRNLAFKDTNKVNALDELAKGVRGIAAKNKLVAFSVTQAGDSAEGKNVLSMGDVDYSNCLAKDTLVLMADGTKTKVQDIAVGDTVMGMDSTPRRVLAVGNGRQALYRITHKNGDTYTVNKDHIMVVKNSDTRPRRGVPPKALVDEPLQTFLEKPSLLRKFKGIWSAGYDGTHQYLPIDPYLFGLWLADGFSHTFSVSTSDGQLVDYLTTEYRDLGIKLRTVNITNTIVSFGATTNGNRNPNNTKLRELGALRNKHIPHIYATSSREQRLKLLAGLIDGDGSLRRTTKNGSDHFSIYVGDSEQLADGILELCKSLGFYCMKGKSHPTCFVVRLSGKVTTIPTIIDRKRAKKDSQIDFLASSITVEKVSDDGEYYGITVDKDERYVLGNYIVTHNTGIPAAVDVMIGLGADKKNLEENYRCVSFPKNKVGGDHSPTLIRIDPHRSLVIPN